MSYINGVNNIRYIDDLKMEKQTDQIFTIFVATLWQ